MNFAALAIESGIPLPPLREPRDPNACAFCYKQPRVAPYKTCDDCRDWARNRQEAQRAAGLCLMTPCRNAPAPEHVLCDDHLTRLRVYAKERRKDQKKRKVCIGCNIRPQWWTLYCVICRFQNGHEYKNILPFGAINAIKEYRRNEAIYDRRRIASKACALLDGRAVRVVSYRHGLYDGYDWSLEEIGQRLEVTRERVRQIEDRAYDDLSSSGLELSRLRVPYYRKRRPSLVKLSSYKQAQHRAHGLVAQAIRDGRITRQPCKECRDPASIAHHHKGYDFPLEIEWLCRHHHMVAHGRGKAGHRALSKRLKPTQPPAWLPEGDPDDPRLGTILNRMRAFRPRLKQKVVIRDSGFTYYQLMRVLRGFHQDDAITNFLDIYMRTLENEQRAKAA